MENKRPPISRSMMALFYGFFVLIFFIGVNLGQNKLNNFDKSVLGTFIAQSGIGSPGGGGEFNPPVQLPTNTPPAVPTTRIIPTTVEPTVAPIFPTPTTTIGEPTPLPTIPVIPPPVGYPIEPSDPIYVPVVPNPTPTSPPSFQPIPPAIVEPTQTPMEPVQIVNIGDGTITIVSGPDGGTNIRLDAGLPEVTLGGGTQLVNITNNAVQLRLTNTEGLIGVFAEIYPTSTSGNTTNIPAMKTLPLSRVAYDIVSSWLSLNRLAIRPLGPGSFTLQHQDALSIVDYDMTINLPQNRIEVYTPSGKKPINYYPDRAVGIAKDTRTISSLSGTVRMTQGEETKNQLAYQIPGTSLQYLVAVIPVRFNRTAYVSAETLDLVGYDQSRWSKILDMIAI